MQSSFHALGSIEHTTCVKNIEIGQISVAVCKQNQYAAHAKLGLSVEKAFHKPLSEQSHIVVDDCGWWM